MRVYPQQAQSGSPGIELPRTRIDGYTFALPEFPDNVYHFGRERVA